MARKSNLDVVLSFMKDFKKETKEEFLEIKDLVKNINEKTYSHGKAIVKINTLMTVCGVIVTPLVGTILYQFFFK